VRREATSAPAQTKLKTATAGQKDSIENGIPTRARSGGLMKLLVPQQQTQTSHWWRVRRVALPDRPAGMRRAPVKVKPVLVTVAE
jgi:hypothetical protein